jgi:hypothetical protein
VASSSSTGSCQPSCCRSRAWCGEVYMLQAPWLRCMKLPWKRLQPLKHGADWCCQHACTCIQGVRTCK